MPKHIVLRLLIAAAAIACATAAYCSDPCPACNPGDGWTLIKKDAGVKTYQVAMDLKSKKNGYVGLICCDAGTFPLWEVPSGVSVGLGSITVPGAGRMSVGSASCEATPLHPCGDRYIGPPPIDPGSVTWILDSNVTEYKLGQDGCYAPAYRQIHLSASGESAAFTVVVSGQTDRYARLNRDTGAAGIDMEADGIAAMRRNHAPDILGRNTVEVKEVLKYPTVTVALGADSVSYTAACVDNDDVIRIEASACSPAITGAPATWPATADSTNIEFVSGTYSRTTGVADGKRSFSYSRVVNTQDGNQANQRVAGSVGGGSFSFCGGFDKGISGNLWHFVFTDHCGAYDVAYVPDLQNMDGRSRSDLQVKGREKHPRETLQDIPHTDCEIDYRQHVYSWEDDDRIELSRNPYVHYGGLWELELDSNMPGGLQRYVDLPEEPTMVTQTGGIRRMLPIMHGDLTAVNIKDTWGGGYVGNSPGEPSHPGWHPWPVQYRDDDGIPAFDPITGEPIWCSLNARPSWFVSWPWYDNQVLMRCGWSVTDALDIALAAPDAVSGEVGSPVQLPGLGWTNATSSGSQVVINTPDSGGTTATAEDLVTGHNLRLTGTRFVNVYWQALLPDGSPAPPGSKADLSIGGHTWHLVSDGSGVSRIDLCSPDESTVQPKKDEIVTIDLDPPIRADGSSAVAIDRTVALPIPAGADSVQVFCDYLGGGCTVSLSDASGQALNSVAGPLPYEWTQVTDGASQLRVQANAGTRFGITKCRYRQARPTMQSTAAYELPLSDGNYTRQWEFPKGWGVGRIVSMKLDCLTPGRKYSFERIQPVRTKPENGGFAKLFVLPHQPAWNDSKNEGDWAWMLERDKYIIPKAQLIVDGAVVLEFPAGTWSPASDKYQAWSLLPDPWIGKPDEQVQNGSRMLAFPSGTGATNGVVTGITTGCASATDFYKANCYTTFLVGGMYPEKDGHIRVPLEITPDAVIQYGGIADQPTIKGMTKRLRGEVKGLAFDNSGKLLAGRQLVVTTPGAPSDQTTNTVVTTSNIGWFETPALNTKGPAHFQGAGMSDDITTRNRFISRLVIGAGACDIDVDPYVIEPAYDDTATVKWRRTADMQMTSLLILREDENGSYVGSDGLHYALEFTITDLAAKEEDTGSTPYTKKGSYIWHPARNQQAGRYVVGIPDGVGHAKVTWTTGSKTVRPDFCVALSVYNVLSAFDAPFRPGDQDKGTTDIHYTLSSAADRCEVRVDDQLVKPNAIGLATDNVYTWNGQIGDQQQDSFGSGVHSIEVDPIVSDKNVRIGSSLKIDSPTLTIVDPTNVTANKLDPETGHVSIGYRIVEPVKRVQATSAMVTALVYDENASIVRRLKTGEPTTAIDNDGDDDTKGGTNSFSWDGRDDNDEPVEAGHYKITLFAKDNAGGGCESPLTTLDVEVADNRCTIDANAEVDGADVVVNGTTNPGNSVSWTDTAESGSAQGTVTPDPDGCFWFVLEQATPGTHTIQLAATDSSGKTANTSVQVFANDISEPTVATNGGQPRFSEAGRFCPSRGETISASFTSTAATDSFTAQVIDPFDTSCTETTMVSDLLNGSVTERLVKQIWTNHGVPAGTSSVAWDGKDSSNNPVASGPYIVRIARSNNDGNLEKSSDVLVTVDGPSNAPAISGVQSAVCGTSVEVSWLTDVPSSGAVLYRADECAIAKVRDDGLKTHHSVYLSITDPESTYTYWVVAKDQAGLTSVSERKEATTEGGENYQELEIVPISDTAFDVTWPTSVAMTGKVQYAQAGAAGTSLTWNTATEAAPATQHVVHLTGLVPHSQYVLRVSSSASASAASYMSPYIGLWTKTSRPSLTIQSPAENETISGTVSVHVVASDAQPRYSENGISNITLSAEGLELAPSNHNSGSQDYYFTLNTTLLGNGYQVINVLACDDYGNCVQRDVSVIVENAAQASSTSSSKSNPTASLSSQSIAIAGECLASLLIQANGNFQINPPKGSPEAVLISTNARLESSSDNRWPDDCQKRVARDGQAMIEISGATPGQWIQLVVHDSPDQSAYRNDRMARDNWGEMQFGVYIGYRLRGLGGLEAVPGYRLEQERIGYMQRNSYKVYVDKRGKAKAILRFWHPASGDNFYVQVKNKEGRSLGESAPLVAWKRAYLEIDRMAIGANIMANASAGNRSIYVPTLHPFRAGDQVVLDSKDEPKEFRTVESVDRDPGAMWSRLILDDGLACSYQVSRRPTVSLTDPGMTYPVRTDRLREAFGDIVDDPSGSSVGGCFVDFKKVPESRNQHSVVAFEEALSCSAQSVIWTLNCDNRHASNVMYVMAANNVLDEDSAAQRGLTDRSDKYSFIGDATISSLLREDLFSNDSIRQYGMTLAHELCHQFDYGTILGADRNVDGTHDTAEAWDHLYSCLMDTSTYHSFPASYARSCAFCPYHCGRIRRFPDPIR